MATLKIPITAEDHIQGSKKAPITVVEYGDYECPYCGDAHFVVKQLQEHFGDQLNMVFRHFPLREVHPDAEIAAEAAEFAASKGKFWEMHDILYENQESLELTFLIEYAESLDLTAKSLEQALKQKTFEPNVQKDFMGGVRSGVNGTPTFFINNERYNGPFTFQAMALAISSVI